MQWEIIQIVVYIPPSLHTLSRSPISIDKTRTNQLICIFKNSARGCKSPVEQPFVGTWEREEVEGFCLQPSSVVITARHIGHWMKRGRWRISGSKWAGTRFNKSHDTLPTLLSGPISFWLQWIPSDSIFEQFGFSIFYVSIVFCNCGSKKTVD